MAEIRFDKVAWNRLISLARPFFFGDMRWYARGMILLLICFAVTLSWVNVQLSYLSRDFMTALSLRERDDFIRHLYHYLLGLGGLIPMVVFYRYSEERLALAWRRWLSHRILRHYFMDRAYYKINFYQGIDNPDQRLEEDVRSFTTNSLSIMIIALNSFVNMFGFMHVLWSISINLSIAVVVVAAFGSLSTYLLGRPLIGLNFEQLKKEGNYRYKLVNVRDNAESIAFYRGEEKEFTRVRQQLKIALKNLLQIINWNRNLSFFTTSYNYLIGILPIVIVAPLYLDGKVEFGVIGQAVGAFGQVVSALSIIVLNFGNLSALTAVVTRLGTFWEGLEEASASDSSSASIIRTKEEQRIAFQNVTILTPKAEQTLLIDLSLELEGRSLLITGPSGSGKSSLLRVVSGLWNRGHGTVVRPSPETMIFLPQRPYMILGSFRSQVMYGMPKKAISDDLLLRVVQKVGLGDTLQRVGGLNSVRDWPNFLSTGEQQRLAFARLVLARPQFAFLDESTTALDLETERRLYAIVQDFSKTNVSVGYRSNLASYHDFILELEGNGKWKLDKSEK